jgi:deoxyribonucleoside regulator
MVNDIDLTKRDLLIKVAKMYYFDELSQQEIADAIKVSRSGVSRMLKVSRDLKIVEIRINDTSSMGVLLQKELMEEFRLTEIVVIPSMKDLEHTKMELGKAAGHLFNSKLKDGMKVGITWGSTLYHMVQQYQPTNKYLDVEIFQLMGGTGGRDLNTDGREHARTMADKLNAKCHVLNAPLIVQNESLRKMLMEEPEISQTLKKMETLDLAIIAVGTNNPDISRLVKIGYLTKEGSAKLFHMGAIGDVCGWHIDQRGQIFPVDIHKRLIGIDFQQLKKVPMVIAVAGGEAKAEAILGVLRAGFINVLITDEEAAMKILSLNRLEQ